jgi:hypothetical protein
MPAPHAAAPNLKGHPGLAIGDRAGRLARFGRYNGDACDEQTQCDPHGRRPVWPRWSATRAGVRDLPNYLSTGSWYLAGGAIDIFAWPIGVVMPTNQGSPWLLTRTRQRAVLLTKRICADHDRFRADDFAQTMVEPRQGDRFATTGLLDLPLPLGMQRRGPYASSQRLIGAKRAEVVNREILFPQHDCAYRPVCRGSSRQPMLRITLSEFSSRRRPAVRPSRAGSQATRASSMSLERVPARR